MYFQIFSLLHICILESYFGVSGEYLRGKIEKQHFEEKVENIHDNLDITTLLMVEFQEKYNLRDQDEQKLLSDILNEVLILINKSPLTDGDSKNFDGQIFLNLIRVYSGLNKIGKIEIVNRANEMYQLEKYKK